MRPLDDFNPLNPGTWGPAFWNAISGGINDMLLSVAQGMIKSLQDLLLNPPRLDGADFVGVLYGNALGILPTLGFAASFFAMTVSIIWQSKAKNLVVAIPLIVLALLANAIWFEWAYGFIDGGTALAKAMNFFVDSDPVKPFIDLPPMVNAPLAALMAMGIGSCIAILWFIVLVYSALNISMIFWFLPAVTLYGLGESAAKFVRIMISVMLVSMFFGRAAALFFINVAKAMGKLPGFNMVLPTYGLLIVGVILAIAIQPVLIWMTYQGVTKTISRIAGSSTVRGKVQTENKDVLDVNVNKLNEQHALAMRAADVASAEARPTQLTRTEEAVLNAKRDAIHSGAIALSAYAASTGAGAVTLGAISHVDKVMTAKVEDRAERKAIARQGSEVDNV